MDMSSTCNILSSSTLAVLLCLSMSTLYVGSLYLLPKETRKLSRDDPKQIMGRSYAVITSSLICIFIFILLSSFSKCDYHWLRLLGIRSDGLLNAIIWPLCLISLLYLGPILTSLLLANIKRKYQIRWSNQDTYILLPNIDTGKSDLSFINSMILVLADRIQSEIFGVAHLHHLFERRNVVHWQQNLLVTMIQFTYTYLFGVFSAFLFFRTGHLIAPMVCHIFCNYWQLPDLGFLDPKSNPLSPLYPLRIILLITYILGIGGFLLSLEYFTSNATFHHFGERWPCTGSHS